MSGLLTIIIMSIFLGAATFAIGSLPLTFTFSKARIAYLSTVGTGLLLGAALGIIIPEGIETMVASNPTSDTLSFKIALSLLVGFAFMLIVEQFSSGHEHEHVHSHSRTPSAGGSTILFSALPDEADKHAETPAAVSNEHEFDVALSELESHEGMALTDSNSHTQGNGNASSSASHANGTGIISMLERRSANEGASRKKAFPLTFGLVIHSLADGLALGASALPRAGGGGGENGGSSQLSIVVFLAILVHKAPTALALTMSLLATNLPRAECRKHIAAFAASTPIGSLLTFGILSFFGSTTGGEGDWTGIALLLSGGTFLYVATVLQPVSNNERSTSDMSEVTRASLIILGMFLPFAISLLVDHDHA